LSGWALALLVIAVQLMVPLAWASFGEIISERAGVINVGLEGAILIGALGAAVGYSNSNSLVLGAFVGLICGLVLGTVLSFLYIWRGVDQVVGGVMVYLLATGLTAALWTRFQGPFTGANFPKIQIPFLSKIPVVGDAIFNQNAFVYAAIIFAPVLEFVMRSTRTGKSIRATGEAPEAVDAAGLSVRWIRTASLVIGTALGAIGGVALVFTSSSGRFVPNMSGGIGFIALGIVLLARWHAALALVATLAFGGLQAFRYVAQANPTLSSLPVEMILATPYVVAIIIVAVSRGSRYPAAMGTYWSGSH
jgi:general nucleoside transport system permease protein